MGDIIVLVVLAGIIALVVRSMWKNHKKGGHCSGCSSSCSDCSGCLTECRGKGRPSAEHDI